MGEGLGADHDARPSPTGTSVPLVGQTTPPATIAMAVVVAATAARAASIPVLRISDAALHLATGRLILSSGAIPRSDPFTFTRLGDPWVVQQWLPATLFGAVESLAGHRGLAALVAATVTVLAVVLARHAREQSAGFWPVVVVAVALFAGAGNWTLRGNIFSFLLLVATYTLVRSERHPGWAFPLFVVWANTHALMLVGLGLVGLAAGVTTLATLTGRREQSDPSPGRLWTLLAFGLAGSLVTPWGLQLYAYALDISSTAPTYVSEWAAPSPSRWDVRAFLLLVVLTAVALARTRRPRLLDSALAVTFAGLGFAALRNVTVAAIVLALVAVRHPPRTPSTHDRTWTRLDRGLLASVVLAGATTVFVLVATLGPFEGRFPLRSLQAVEGDRLWTEETWSTAALVLQGGDLLVNVDGRVSIHGEEGYRDFLLVRNAEDGWEAWLDRWCVDEVVVSEEAPLVTALSDATGWRRVAVEPIDSGAAHHYVRVGSC